MMAPQQLPNKMRPDLKKHRTVLKTIAFFLAFHIVMMSGPYQSLWAAMIRTDSILNEDRSRLTRDRLDRLLAREDIQAALVSRGIDPQEARARIDSLTDAEVDRIADMMDQLPAGGGFFETFIVVVLLVFLILLFTDIYGYTDVFPFVTKHRTSKTTEDKAAVETVSKEEPRSVSEYAGIGPGENLIILFKPNSNDLTADAIYQLDRVAEFMSKNPETGVKVKGFSDSTGTASYDQMVSEIRANTVKNYLIAKGVSHKKIATEGMGSQDIPAGTAPQAKGRAVLEFN
jgi:outer membrane protein OmpA-like peptidoglycan-associated protein